MKIGILIWLCVMLCITHEITVCQSEFFSKLERIFRKQKKNERESSSQSPFEVLYASCDKGFGNEENEKAFLLHFNASRTTKIPSFALYSQLCLFVNTCKPPWRNRLARSAVNRKVGGSSPPGGETFYPRNQN